MNPIEAAARRLPRDLRAVGAKWALVGGLAVSAHAGGRATTDVDVAVTVADETEADRLVLGLQGLGYRVATILTDAETGGIETVRLESPAGRGTALLFDLLLHTSGIEPEIVTGAELLEVLPRLHLPVARLGHLVAMKVLSERDDRLQDRVDLHGLIEAASPEDLNLARVSVELIQVRKPSVAKDLTARLDQFIREAREPGPR
jgi:hypothetical protein